MEPLKKRLGVSFLLGSILTIVAIGIVFGIDYNAQKDQITYWNTRSPRNPDPNYCEYRYPRISKTQSNTTLINGQKTTQKSNSSYYFVRERFNGFTALFFTFPSTVIGVFFFLDLKKTQESILSKYYLASFFLGLVSFAHTIGTFLNHTCACQIGLILDNLFLWVLLGSLILNTGLIYLKGVISYFKLALVVILYFIFYLGLLITLSLITLPLYAHSTITGVNLAIIIVSNVVLAFKIKRVSGLKKLLTAAVVVTIIGVIMALIDSVACSDQFKIGTHFLWHILGSAGQTMIYLYHWSIREQGRDDLELK